MYNIDGAKAYVGGLDNLLSVMSHYGTNIKDKKYICPFHGDTNPSGSVYFKKTARYNCFVCNESGDIFDFIAIKEGWSVKDDFIRIIKKAFEILNADVTLYIDNKDMDKKELEAKRKAKKEEAKKKKDLVRMLNDYIFLVKDDFDAKFRASCIIDRVNSNKLTSEDTLFIATDVMDVVLSNDEYKRRLYALVFAYRNRAIAIDSQPLIKKANDALTAIYNNEITEEHQLEFVNYAMFKVNDDIDVKYRLGENADGLYEAVRVAYNGGTSAIFAGTGSGKTRTTAYMLKKGYDKGTTMTFSEFMTVCKFQETFPVLKAIIVLPNVSNVEQVEKTYNIPGAYGDVDALDALKRGDVCVMTWDKMKKLVEAGVDLTEHILVIDEIHQIYIDIFRKKAVDFLVQASENFRGVVHITATPSKLDFSKYDYIARYNQATYCKYDVKMYNDINYDNIASIMNKAKKSAVLMDDKEVLNTIKDSLLDPSKADVIHSGNKDTNITYKNIMENENFGGLNHILNTSTMTACVNIKEPEITDVIVVGISDPAIIRQYVARFRELSYVRVHIFNKYREYKRGTTFSVEDSIAYKVNKLEHEVVLCNSRLKANKYDLALIALDVDDMPIEYSRSHGKFICNATISRGKTYMSYYTSRSIEQYEVLLKEFFDDVTIVDIKSQDDEIKAMSKDRKAELKVEAKETMQLLTNAKGLKDVVLTKVDKYISSDWDDLKSKLGVDIKPLLENRYVKDVVTLSKKYVEENEYSQDYAWAVAQLGEKQRNALKEKINNLVYREVQKRNKDICENGIIMNELYDRIVEGFKPGTAYRKEHLQMFIDEVNKDEAFRVMKLTTDKLGKLLNSIYKIKGAKSSKEAPNFYKGLTPECNGEGRINYNIVESFLTANDINMSVGVVGSDTTIIEKMVKPMLKHYDL